MPCDTTVGVNQYLTSRQTTVAGWAAGNEPTTGVHKDFGICIKKIVGHYFLDNVLCYVFLDLLVTASGWC